MSTDRRLIVNADDFGYSRGINRGIIRAHEQGIVTSTSLMVRWPDAADAAACARENPRLSVGLHLDFGEWHYEGGQKCARYVVVPPDSDIATYEDEVRRQFDAFRVLMGREPSHFDSHQHVHFREPVRSLLRRMSMEMKLPLRAHSPPVGYCGGFYGQNLEGRSHPERVTVPALCAILARLPGGVIELGCHPALEVDFESTYGRERIEECATLCDPSVAQFAQDHGYRLESFHDVSLRESASSSRPGASTHGGKVRG